MAQKAEQTEATENERDLNESASIAGDRLDLLVSTILDNVNCTALLHPALDVIERYDADNQTDLLHTLKVYLENDCNAQKCGRLLFLHRNSLVYRIHRIQEISGCDLSNPEERSYLRISFLLRN